MAPANLSRNLASLAGVGLAVRGRQVSLTYRTALAELAIELPDDARARSPGTGRLTYH
jgi:hypothetical protein